MLSTLHCDYCKYAGNILINVEPVKHSSIQTSKQDEWMIFMEDTFFYVVLKKEASPIVATLCCDTSAWLGHRSWLRSGSSSAYSPTSITARSRPFCCAFSHPQSNKALSSKKGKSRTTERLGYRALSKNIYNGGYCNIPCCGETYNFVWKIPSSLKRVIRVQWLLPTVPGLWLAYAYVNLLDEKYLNHLNNILIGRKM